MDIIALGQLMKTSFEKHQVCYQQYCQHLALGENYDSSKSDKCVHVGGNPDHLKVRTIFKINIFITHALKVGDS